MSSNSFLFDTNIFIYYLNAEPSVEKLFSRDFLSANNIYYSIITEIELLSFPKLSEEENKVIKELLEKFYPISLTEDVKEKTIVSNSFTFINILPMSDSLNDYYLFYKINLIDNSIITNSQTITVSIMKLFGILRKRIIR